MVAMLIFVTIITLVTSAAADDKDVLLRYVMPMNKSSLCFDNWLPTTPLRAFKSVTVDATSQRVTGLYLQNCGLLGALPSALAQLTELKELSFANNRLNSSGGTMESWTFPSLRSLNVGSCGLSDGLPRWNATGMPNLAVLDLSHNSFSGPLPAEWGSVGTLQQISVGSNLLLSGTVPGSWAQLSNLRSLNLGQNMLSGNLPAWSSNDLPVIEAMDFSNNAFSSAVPWTEWATLTTLHDLSVNSNQLSGTLDPSWSRLWQMRTLSLCENPELGGVLPERWDNMSKLEWLCVRHTSITLFFQSRLACEYFANITRVGCVWCGALDAWTIAADDASKCR